MVVNSAKPYLWQRRAKSLEIKKGVETRHYPPRTGEGIVQTTNTLSGNESYSGKKIPRSSVSVQI